VADDNVIPLASAASITEGPFADLVREYSAGALADLLAEATRACETEVERRLAPFTISETHRATGIDPDEYTDSANLPMDINSAIGRSYAAALGATNLVRHCWVNEYPPHFQEMWTASVSQIQVVRSYGGSQILSAQQWIGPEPDGHIWFQLGQFIPVGSLVRITYSGGYATVPADLRRACKYMAASIAARELDPLEQSGHKPDSLQDLAVSWLTPYARA
jgi:hypothetical protein